MTIFKRVRDITVASINDMLDKVEDPVAMLNQYLRDLESEISKAEIAVSRQVAIEKKWKTLVNEFEERVTKRNRQAELAVDHGDEKIARQAIADKQFAESRLTEYRALFESAKQQVAILLGQLKELKDQYYELRNKKLSLVSRANAAKAIKDMNQALVSIDTESAGKGFARMEEKVMMMEADSQAIQSIRRVYAGLNYDNLHKAETNDKVERELAKLIAARNIISNETVIANEN
ncbi:PspA/IM30 family protein [Calidifontibacillus oryziterrae]|uniref:PspA/IM30 family protein n=1 Tax=Calidifontibacillus oryziterrae TaxID=1191699 RepID=UPI000303D0F2|nr:PspA/IM30 family protein [Calidifontibacillus oryziterrae]